MFVFSEPLVVTVIVALPTGGLSRYQISLRTKNVPDAPAPQDPPELSSVAFKHVRLLDPYVIVFTNTLPLGLLLNSLKDTPTSKILPLPEPMV